MYGTIEELEAIMDEVANDSPREPMDKTQERKEEIVRLTINDEEEAGGVVL